MNLIIRAITFLVTAFLLVSCGGGGSDSGRFKDGVFNYSGTWEVRYNALEAVTDSTCGNLFGEETFQFTDRHLISQSDTLVSLTATSGVIIGQGEVDENQVLMASELLTGDLFSDGRNCELSLKVSYQNVRGEIADTFFLQSLSCDGAIVCEDQATGTATLVSLEVA